MTIMANEEENESLYAMKNENTWEAAKMQPVSFSYRRLAWSGAANGGPAAAAKCGGEAATAINNICGQRQLAGHWRLLLNDSVAEGKACMRLKYGGSEKKASRHLG